MAAAFDLMFRGVRVRRSWRARQFASYYVLSHCTFRFASFNRFRSFAISFFREFTVPWESSLMDALFLIFFALLANFSVLIVSPVHFCEGEIFAINEVLLLPPSESLSK